MNNQMSSHTNELSTKTRKIRYKNHYRSFTIPINLARIQHQVSKCNKKINWKIHFYSLMIKRVDHNIMH